MTKPVRDDSDQELLSLFEEGNLTPFSNEELSLDMRTLGFPRVPTRGRAIDLEQLADYRGIAPFIRALDRYLAKPVFGRDSLDQWEEFYVLPRKSSLRKYTRSHLPNSIKTFGISNQIVNRSPEAVSEWIDRTVIANLAGTGIADDRPLIVMLGGIGCGKSTFNKYITNFHFNKLKYAKIIPTRVEYRKFYNTLRWNGMFSNRVSENAKNQIQRKLQDYIVDCLIRDNLRICFTDVDSSNSGQFEAIKQNSIESLDIEPDGEEANLKFEDFLDFECASPEQTAQIKSRVIKIMQRYKLLPLNARVSWLKETLSDSLSRQALTYFLKFSFERGFRPYVILDGFDYVQAADYLDDTSHALVLDAVADWIVQYHCEVKTSSPGYIFKPLVQLTSRVCTNEYFWTRSDFSNAFGGTAALEFHVAAPEFRDLYRRMLSGLGSHFDSQRSEEGISELSSIFDRIQAGLKDEIGIRPGRFGPLFRENVRFRLNFARNVFVQAAREALDASDSSENVTPYELMQTIDKDFGGMISRQRSYRLIDILLYSSGERFSNFVMIDGIERWLSEKLRKEVRFLSESILSDNNRRSGYVGNIFNYHIPYSKPEDIEFFLEKYRIVHLLCARPLDKVGIIKEFDNNNWRMSKYFDISLALLIREAFVKGEFAEPHGRYVIEPHGKFVKEKLVHQMIYLENIFFGCWLPGIIQTNAVDIVRTEKNTHQWVAASIYHMWLLLKIIKTAETKGQMVAFTDIYPGLFKIISNIVEKDQYAGERSLSQMALNLIRAFQESVDESS